MVVTHGVAQIAEHGQCQFVRHIAVGYAAAIVEPPCQQSRTGSCRLHQRAQHIGVLHLGRLVFTIAAADESAHCGAAAKGAHVVAVFQCAVELAHKASRIVRCAGYLHIAEAMADGGGLVTLAASHQRTRVGCIGHIGNERSSREPHIADSGAAYGAEEHAVGVLYHMALSVERARIGPCGRSDGLEAGTVGQEVDVGCQPGAGLGHATVHVLHKLDEVLCGCVCVKLCLLCVRIFLFDGRFSCV